MKKFNLIEALSARREQVIKQYNDLREEKFFDGISLRDFMYEVIGGCQCNKIASEKRLDNSLISIVGIVYMRHCNINLVDSRQARLEKKYKGTQFEALI